MLRILASFISLLILSGVCLKADSKTASSTLPSVSINRGSWRSVIMPNDDVRLSTQTDGVIAAYPHAEGDRVKKDDVVVILDDRIEKVELTNAEAILRRASAEREKARKDYERIKSLYDEKIASEKQYLDTVAALEQSEAGYIQAEQSLAMARIRLDYRYIKSPIDGIFYKKVKSVGEALNRYDVAARIIDDSGLEMVIYASPQYFGKFTKGDSIDIQLLDGPHASETVVGVVDYADSLIDPASGTFRVKIRLQPSDSVYAGLGALVLPETLKKPQTPAS